MKKWLSLIILVIVLIIGLFYFTKLSGSTNAASVNGENITRQAFNSSLQEAQNMHNWQKQPAANINTLQRDILNNLIDGALIKQYASSHSITVSDSEVNNRYIITVGSYNNRDNLTSSSDNAFLARINQMYGIGKNEYLQTIKMDLLKQKVQASVGEPLVLWLTRQKKSADIKTSP